MVYTVMWLDDVREPDYFWNRWVKPDDMVNILWYKSVNEATSAYRTLRDLVYAQIIIDLDHDAGDYALQGGDYIKFLDWLEATYPMDFPNIAWRIHSMNPVGIANMRQILERNGAHLK